MTDAIWQVVAAWCTRENPTVSSARAAVLLSALGFATFESFLACELATLRRYLERLANTAGEETTMILAAHKHFMTHVHGGRGETCAEETADELAEVTEVFRAARLDLAGFI